MLGSTSTSPTLQANRESSDILVQRVENSSSDTNISDGSAILSMIRTTDGSRERHRPVSMMQLPEMLTHSSPLYALTSDTDHV